MEVLEKLEKLGIVPVVVLNDAKNALPLAKALVEGGLPCAEVTFRTDAAEESIRQISAAYPEMLVGAGTVLTVEQVDRAVKAGAKFIVAPGFDPEIVTRCQELGIPMMPGVMTPSEITAARKMGLMNVKFFPAENAGGLKMILAMGAAFVGTRFMPTGGLNAANVRDYLKDPHILCCGGSWMVKSALIESGDFEKIKEMTAEAAAIVKEIRG